MSAKKRKAASPGPREIDVGLGIEGQVRFIRDPRTLRQWEWIERDQPGLYDFLRDFIRRWHRPAVAGKNSRKGSSTGGTKSAEKKQIEAAEWQDKILPRVKRMLAAGKSDPNIAVLLAPNTITKKKPARGVEAVTKFVAKVRKAEQKNTQ